MTSFATGHDRTVSRRTAVSIVVTPVALCAAFALGLWLNVSRAFFLRLLDENQVVELLTFAVLLAGGVYALSMARRLRRRDTVAALHYTGFGVALMLIGMEEVAWGQWLLGFETPERWAAINMQGETTIHNLQGLQGNTEFLRFLFGIGGIAGIALAHAPWGRAIGASHLLLSWFVIIAAHSVVDYYNDVTPIGATIDFFIQRTSELIELLIALAAFVYLWLNRHLF